VGNLVASARKEEEEDEEASPFCKRFRRFTEDSEDKSTE
jgi:hypothetical protein